jgi:hypothetical protein
MSIDHFDRYVRADLKTVRVGSLRLYPVAEIERWLERNASSAREDVQLLRGSEPRTAPKRPANRGVAESWLKANQP